MNFIHMDKKAKEKRKAPQETKEYPQVRKTGVDEVHEKLPTEGLYHEEMYFVMFMY